MKSFRNLSLLLLVLVISSAFTLKKNKQTAVYVAGVSASFTDSIVYFTDVQLIDSAKLDAHGFLPDRAMYSAQLKSYLEESQALKNRVCLVYFSDDKAKLEKQVNKIKDKYIKSKKSYIRELKSDDFKFTKPVVEEE